MTFRMMQVLVRVATAAILLATVLVGSSSAGDTPLAPTLQELPPSVSRPLSPAQALPSAPQTELETFASRHTDPEGEPVRVVIPVIDVDADLVGVGLKADGAMQVPNFGLAAWYTEGPKPGHSGPAVIVAHVDSRAGPDIFYRLGDLGPNDEIHVVYDSGDEVAFILTSSEQAPKDRLPVDAIWPTTNERLLTLITCGGEFDRSVQHYRDNVIVYATLRAET